MTTLLNNRYQTIQLLGAGGFGETFLAEDTYLPSRRRCVIKQLKPMTNDPQMYQLIQQRFQREAAILESLGEGSDYIPKLYAYFSENGQFYLVQEWIHGQTLSHKVEAEGALSETAVRDILLSLLQVLDYLHSQGIIHRDIKPDNILLRELNGKPVLIDFGAVKETMTTLLVNAQGKTKHSVVLGTPGYMSPEQATGRSLYASDIYSLGMTAIYLLTGKQPQELELDSKNEQLLWQQYAPQVSSHFAAILNQAIQYHPRDRYTTAIKMLDAIHSITPIPPRQSSTQATLVVSSVGNKATSEQVPVTSKQSPVLTHSSSQKNGQKRIILGSLLVGSLLGAAVVFSFVSNQLPQSTLEQPSQTPVTEPTKESPAPVIVQSPASPTEAEENQQQTAQVGAETTQSQNQQQATPNPTSTDLQPENKQTAQNSTPPIDTAAQPENQQQTAPNSPAPTETAPPTPQPQTTQDAATPTPSAPQQDNEQIKDSAVNNTRESIPAFPVGTSESDVKAALGNPTKTSKGVWANTRAVLYEVDPNRITMGYLFDRNSNQIRQSEVSFAQSVEPEVMQATLRRMLGDRALINVRQGLQQVYQRRTNKYTFNVGELKGVIERNDRDRIYIGIWDADLH